LKQGRVVFLALLLLLWGYVVFRHLSSGGDAATVERTTKAKKAGKKKRAFPIVDLSLLEQKNQPKKTPERNPFDYHVKRAAPPPRRTPPPPPPTRKAPPPPPPTKQAVLPPPPPPITFKFEGGVTRGEEKYAILRDEEGILHVGKEGDTVAFRFKVLKIGHESIDMGYVDNAARQQIELSGS